MSIKLPVWASRINTKKTASFPNAADSLDAFGSEQRGGSFSPSRAPDPVPWTADDLRRLRIRLAAAILIISVGTGGYLLRQWRPFKLEAASASLTIESDPVGAEVYAFGKPIGTTPLTVPVASGAHTFELVYQGRRKWLRAVTRGSTAVVHHVQFDAASPPGIARTALRIATEPTGLRVFFDGKPLGASPATAENIAPGAHKVKVVGAGTTLERRVDVQAGEAASVLISVSTPSAPAARIPPAAPAGPAAGWVTITSPVTLQITEGRDVVGTSQSPRIMLPTGTHELQLANEDLGVATRVVVEIVAGKTATVVADVPNAPLSINALPWAEAWLDGKRLGETPIGNHPVAIGSHEVVFRHPELGERRQTVTVTLKRPARVSVDMRKPQ